MCSNIGDCRTKGSEVRNNLFEKVIPDTFVDSGHITTQMCTKFTNCLQNIPRVSAWVVSSDNEIPRGAQRPRAPPPMDQGLGAAAGRRPPPVDLRAWGINGHM